MAYSTGRRIGMAFWQSGELVSEPWWARVLLGTMLSATDAQGRVRGSVTYLQAVFMCPVTGGRRPSKRAVSALLARKIDSGMLAKSTVEGVEYLTFTRFKEHQKLRSHHRQGARSCTGEGKMEGKGSAGERATPPKSFAQIEEERQQQKAQVDQDARARRDVEFQDRRKHQEAGAMAAEQLEELAKSRARPREKVTDDK